MSVISSEKACGYRLVVSLPADGLVWAASPKSALLGSDRFIWAHWDVQELKQMYEKYQNGEEKGGLEVMSGLLANWNFTFRL